MHIIRMVKQKRLAIELKEFRTARGMTQMGLAKKAGLTQVHIARLESGNHDPTLGKLQRLAKALKVMEGELVE